MERAPGLSEYQSWLHRALGMGHKTGLSNPRSLSPHLQTAHNSMSKLLQWVDDVTAGKIQFSFFPAQTLGLPLC